MRKTGDLTQGSVFKCLIYFALPLLVGNVFQQLYNVADTAIIGNLLGDNALASVGASAPVYNLVIGFAGGLTNGFAVIIARYFGAKDEKNMKKSVALTYFLSAVTAVIITAVGLIGLEPLLKALKTPDDIIGGTQEYLRIILTFSSLSIIYNMFAALLRAVGNSKAPLYFLVISAIMNVGLDILFVKYLSMGIAGAAYATVISQAISIVLCMIYVLKKCDIVKFRKSYFSMDKKMLGDLVSTGLSMALMFAIVSVGSVILQSAVNKFGATTITAHCAARKIDEMFMMPISITAMSVSTFTSQNYGAGRIDRVKAGIRCGFIITSVWSIISILICIFFRTSIIQLITGTSDTEVLSISSRYLIWNFPFFVILGVLIVLRSSLQGLGKKLVPIMGSVVEFLLKILAVIYIAPKLGYFGICILEPVIWTICAAIVFADYRAFMHKSGKKQCRREYAAAT